MRCDSEITVLITGGGSGLGAGTALHLNAAGCKVVAFDLPNAAERSRVEAAGVRLLNVDVQDSAAIADALDDIDANEGTPRVVVNCAGIAPAARAVSRNGPHDPEQFARVININLVGSFLVASQVADRMTRLDPRDDNERGVIINTASVAAFDGQIGQCAYAASKAGIAGLTLPLARDLSSLGIRALAIAPGIFSTPMLQTMPEEVQQSLAAQVPFPKRLGLAEDYAALVQHMIENRMLNGEVVRLDGAIRMGMR